MRYPFLSLLTAVISFYVVLCTTNLHTLESLQPYVLIPPLTSTCDTSFNTNLSSVTISVHTTLTRFNATNSNTDCFAILIETSYSVAPPLIVAIDHLGKVYYASGRLVVAETYTTELEVSIYYVSDGHAEWSLVARPELVVLESGSLKPSQSLVFSHLEAYIITHKYPLHPTGHLVDYALTLRNGAIYESTMSMLGTFELTYNIYDRKSKYLAVECNYTILRPARHYVKLHHILTLDSKVKYWRSPSHIVLETTNDVNSTYGIIRVSNETVTLPYILYGLPTTTYSASLLSKLDYEIETPCVVKYLEPVAINTNCYDMIEKRCSYDVECPNSTCDALYNRCKYTTQQIITCVVGSLELDHINHLSSKYNTSAPINYLVSKYSNKDDLRRQISYKIDPGCVDPCPRILVSYMVDESICTCRRLTVVDVVLPKRNTCMNVDINYNPLCGEFLRCGRCDGQFCIYEQTSNCYNLCFNPARTLAMRDTCLTYSRSALASCIVDGIVSTQCNNTCGGDQFISYSSCSKEAPTRASNGNIATEIGEVVPNRFNYGIGGLGYYRVTYDWTTFFNDIFNYSKKSEYLLINTTHTIARGLNVTTGETLNVSISSTGVVTLSSNHSFTYCTHICFTTNITTNILLGCKLEIVIVPVQVRNYSMSGPTTINGGSLIVNGNLTLTEESVITIESVSSTPFSVDGCINLGGTLNVSQLNQTTVLFTHNNCINGSFDRLVLPPEEECHTVSYKQLNSSIVLLIDFTCDSMLYIYVSIAVAIFAVLLIGTIVLLYFKCKKVRQEIAPFHDRKYWHPKKEESGEL